MKAAGVYGRVIVITGVTHGIGNAMARMMAEDGNTIVGCGRSTDQIASMAAEFGHPHIFACVDVASEQAVADWAANVARSISAPDLLINNAAIITPPRHVYEVPADEFSLIVDVNVKGVANVIRHFVPSMIRRGKGIIVNISSGWGRGADPGFGPYITTKWAVEGMTQALALELPQGMAAVTLSPGIIDTRMLREAFGEGASQYHNPKVWARKAVPYILGISVSDNGRQMSIE